MMIFGWQKRSKRGRSLAAAGGFLLLLAALSPAAMIPAVAVTAVPLGSYFVLLLSALFTAALISMGSLWDILRLPADYILSPPPEPRYT